jgi:hypothetical protein
MIGDACVFALTQISNDFSCEYGDLVTRRAGPDIACRSEQHQQQCSCVYQQLKKAGLAEFDYEDDLGQVPHGVWAKIQFGGLLGLHGLTNNDGSEEIKNIANTIENVIELYGSLEQIPYKEAIPSMQSYRMRRKRK